MHMKVKSVPSFHCQELSERKENDVDLFIFLKAHLEEKRINFFLSHQRPFQTKIV